MKPVAFIGIPYDEKSSFMAGAAEGPDAIRDVLHDGSSNFWTEEGIELQEGVHFVDKGNYTGQFPDFVESALTQQFEEFNKVISLGGDHSITYPLFKAVQKQFGKVEILHLDAHTDLYESFEGDPLSHACPFARIMDEKLASGLTQVGIRNVPTQHREYAQDHGVNIITMRDWVAGSRPRITDPVYISLDLDVFDPAFVPGVSHHEPGGLTPREVLTILFDLDVPVIGADIVELNPTRDWKGVTAMVGAKFLKEIIGLMHR